MAKRDGRRISGLGLVMAVVTWAGPPGAVLAQESQPAVGGSAQPAATQPGGLDYDRAQVGELGDGRIVVPTNQVLSPAGRQVEFPGRPTDLALSPDGTLLAVLNWRDLTLVDVARGTVRQKVAYRGPRAGGSFTGIAFSPDGRRIYASNIGGSIEVLDIGPDGTATAGEPITLTSPRRNPVPAGLALHPDGRRLYVVLNLRNALGELDLERRELLREIPVGSAPYGVVLLAGRSGQPAGRAVVSNWGGGLPGPGTTTGPSGRGTPVKVDARHIASEGTVSVVDLEQGTVTAEVVVGLHPSGLAAGPTGLVYVANANSDTVSVVDASAARVLETISIRPDERLLFGSAPNALALVGPYLYVSNGANNAIAVIRLAAESGGAPDPAGADRSRLVGLIPTGWYPAGLVADPARGALYVANVKGTGSRDRSWVGQRKVKGRVVFGYNTWDHRGSVGLLPIPDEAGLAAGTRTVLENNRLTESISALAPARPDQPPRPVPQRHGEPSVFAHVIYIIKENRTYDQVLGDLPQGEGDPTLCIFGREVTPNHHQLAEEFVLFDNFYCSGVLSVDGHAWTDEAYPTDYVEKAFGGWPRSYPYDGGDALAYASSGFLWDNALAAGRTLRVYGEFVQPHIRWKDPQRPGRPSFLDCYRDFIGQTGLIDIRATANIATLEPYICPTYIGFPYLVPDVYRAAEFIRELREFEQRGNLPNLCILLLPNDHTEGTTPGAPTPQAAVADNDLALGRIVAAVSHSRFWPRTCICVVQDDPQNGFDHIDAHRTVALVISPYTKRGVVDSTNYNQTSLFRTIELMLRLPPLNQFDASATAMTTCFTDTPDLRPYDAVPNHIPLDQLNPPVRAIRDPVQRKWALKSLELPLEDVDRADEDTLNRILWHACRGDDATYPAWAVSRDPDEDDADDD